MRRANEVPLSELWAGRVVRMRDEDEYGHITGFSRNTYNELTLRVQWSRISNSFTDDVSVHLANVFLVE